ncbi:MAG: hypothetical protein R2911_19965 [Caldilineaceae bacterium]
MSSSWRSLYNTLYIHHRRAAGMIVSFTVALLLNQKVRFMAAYRTA